MSLSLDAHREYISDVVRLDLFRQAIAECVSAGAVVADVGSGTGILGLLACQAGAERVYAVEATGMIEIARALAAANGYSDRFRFLQRHSSEAQLPERIDVCVSDFIGRFGFDAGIFEIYPFARARWLKPAGALMPSDISMFIAPVERADIDERVRLWSSDCAGFDVSPAFEWAANVPYPLTLDAGDLLGEGVLLARMSTGETPTPIHASIELTIARDAMLHGLGGWCAAQLSPGVSMTNSPLSSSRIQRGNLFLPIRTPQRVQAGDRVDVRMGILPTDQIVSWSVEVVSSSGERRGRQTHSTLRGLLVSREDLVRSRPDFVPALTERGRARLTVLQLCDGRRSLGDVEALVFERHGNLFGSPAAAAAFVGEVVSANVVRSV